MKIAKKLLSIATAMLCGTSIFAGTLPITANAENYSEEMQYGDYLYYNQVDEDEDGTYDYVEITDCDGSVTEVEIPSEIDGLTVASIGIQAFMNCFELTSIEIPDSVTSIGNLAFSGTPWLDAKYSENPLVIVNRILIDARTCSGDVVIPDSVTSIGDRAFLGCDSLTSIEIPDGVTSIGDNAFESCDSLTSINVSENNSEFCSIDGVLFNKDATELICYPMGKNNEKYIIPDSVASIGNDAFGLCRSLTSIEIPDSVTSIGDRAFNCCSSLTSIEIPNSVTSIGDFAFENCDSLTSIEIPDGVTSIGNCAFQYCESLTSIEFPDSVTSIGYKAFQYCESLTSIEIPDSVTSIGDYAFWYCESLTSIEIPDGVTLIGREPFGNTLWLEAKRQENPLVIVNSILIDAQTCRGEVVIPDGVTSIVSGAFEDCDSLTSIEIPDSVTSIGEFSFAFCGSLTSIEIPDGVKSIRYGAFKGCSSLASIEIPNSVTTISWEAFASCRSLTSIEIPNSVTSIGNSAFEYCESLTSIEIPDSVTSIGVAFDHCKGLMSITILNPECVICDSKYTINNGYDYDSDSDSYNYYFNGTIHGYEDSTAQAYAEEYGYNFESLGKSPLIEPVKGDSNGDGVLNIRDAAFIARKLVEKKVNEIPEWADYNGDGKVNIRDAAAIARYLTNKYK